METAETFALPDKTVAVSGDWHADVGWVQDILPKLRGKVTTLLHVGDFALWPAVEHADFAVSVDYWAKRAGIERVLVTPGNHEDWGRLQKLYDAHPGQAVRMSDAVWALPRGFRFTIDEASFLSFGGAVSVDRHHRVEGRSWWPEENVTERDVQRAISGGPADVMIAHDTVNGSGVWPVDRILLQTGQWPADVIAQADESRRKVTRVWDAVRPDVLFHGHYHVRGSGRRGDGRRVEALDMNGRPGNVVLFQPRTREVTPLG